MKTAPTTENFASCRAPRHECLKHRPRVLAPSGVQNQALRAAKLPRRADSLASVIEATHLTPETHARLVAELEDLTTRGRVEIARQIEAARALGDLSENGDYHAAKDAQGKMESRVRQLQRMLEDAVIVDSSTHEDGVVTTRQSWWRCATRATRGRPSGSSSAPSRSTRGGRVRRVARLAARPGAARADVGRRRSSTRRPAAPSGSRSSSVGDRAAWHRARSPRRSGTRHVVRPGDGENRTCSTSTCTWSTRSPRPRPSTGCGWRAGRVRRPDLTVATADHNVPTTDIDRPVADPDLGPQLEVARRPTAPSSASPATRWATRNQGIVHVIGPEQGLTQPGMTIVCGDSHTSTHGAFGALAFGIGTSEVEHVLATQTLPQRRPKTMAVTVDGRPRPRRDAPRTWCWPSSARIGTGGGMGHVIEYRGSAIRVAVHGGPDDGLQHVDRSRRPGRA